MRPLMEPVDLPSASGTADQLAAELERLRIEHPWLLCVTSRIALPSPSTTPVGGRARTSALDADVVYTFYLACEALPAVAIPTLRARFRCASHTRSCLVGEVRTDAIGVTLDAGHLEAEAIRKHVLLPIARTLASVGVEHLAPFVSGPASTTAAHNAQDESAPALLASQDGDRVTLAPVPPLATTAGPVPAWRLTPAAAELLAAQLLSAAREARAVADAVAPNTTTAAVTMPPG